MNIDSTAIDYNFIGNDRKPLYVCTWLASKSVPLGQVMVKRVIVLVVHWLSVLPD